MNELIIQLLTTMIIKTIFMAARIEILSFRSKSASLTLKMHRKYCMNRGTQHNFVDHILLKTWLGLYTLKQTDSNQRKQTLDLNINKNVFRYGAINTPLDIDMESLHLKVHRKCFMNRETQMNFVKNKYTVMRLENKNKIQHVNDI